MPRNARTLILLFLLLALSNGLQAQQWQWNRQAGCALGRDNNIFESPQRPTSTLTGRFHLNISGSGRLSTRWHAGVEAQAGIQGFAAYHTENRSLIDFTTQLVHQTARRIQISTRLRYRGKSYFSTDQGYQLPMLQIEITGRLASALRGHLYFRSMVLDYSQGRLYDHRQREAGLKLIWAASSQLRMAWQAAIGGRRYDRTPVNWNANAEGGDPWTYGSGRQYDSLWRASWQLEYYRHMLIRVRLGYEKVTSNSTGFNYSQPAIQLTAAREIGTRNLLHLKSVWRGKHYDNPLNPSLQLRPDTESEDMSMTVFEFTHSLNPETQLSIRWGWYENESPYRNRYYQKTLIGLGLRIQF